MKRGQLDLETVIRTLAQYSLIHTPIVGLNRNGKMQAYGLTVYDDKTIYLDPRQGHSEMLDSTIHEIFHAQGDVFNLKYDEEEVQKYTKKMMNEIFGKYHPKK